MEGNFLTSMYNRKSSIAVKKPVQWIFIKIVQYLLIIDSTVRIIGPVHIIGI